MSCEHLICARCASPVAEGRCPACRATRDHIHSHSNTAQHLLIAGVLVLMTLLLLLLLTHLGR
jgi:hypothetical protein